MLGILTFLAEHSSVMMSLTDKTHKTTKSNHICGFPMCLLAKEVLSLYAFKLTIHGRQRETHLSTKEGPSKHTVLWLAEKLVWAILEQSFKVTQESYAQHMWLSRCSIYLGKHILVRRNMLSILCRIMPLYNLLAN